MEVNKVLEERDKRYGDTSFYHRASNSQALKQIARSAKYYECLSVLEKEALDMILHKIARIVGGEINRKDSWLDIAGYAELVLKELYKQRG